MWNIRDHVRCLFLSGKDWLICRVQQSERLQPSRCPRHNRGLSALWLGSKWVTLLDITQLLHNDPTVLLILQHTRWLTMKIMVRQIWTECLWADSKTHEHAHTCCCMIRELQHNLTSRALCLRYGNVLNFFFFFIAPSGCFNTHYSSNSVNSSFLKELIERAHWSVQKKVLDFSFTVWFQLSSDRNLWYVENAFFIDLLFTSSRAVYAWLYVT